MIPDFTFTPYQVAIPLLALLMVGYAWSLVFRKKKTVVEGILWAIFWLGVAYISIRPNSLQYLSSITGIKKNENAATITALGILFFGVFYLVIRIEELEQRVIKMIRERAIAEAEKDRGPK